MSYLLGAPIGDRTTTGSYVAHRDGARYAYDLTWRFAEPGVVWNGVVYKPDGTAIRVPKGTIEMRLLNREDPERWVHAAIELAIERMHDNV